MHDEAKKVKGKKRQPGSQVVHFFGEVLRIKNTLELVNANPGLKVDRSHFSCIKTF